VEPLSPVPQNLVGNRAKAVQERRKVLGQGPADQVQGTFRPSRDLLFVKQQSLILDQHDRQPLPDDPIS
jgi:hypothetical protein